VTIAPPRTGTKAIDEISKEDIDNNANNNANDDTDDNCWREICWWCKRSVMWKLQAHAVLLLAMVADLLESSMLLTQLHFNLFTGAHLPLAEC